MKNKTREYQLSTLDEKGKYSKFLHTSYKTEFSLSSLPLTCHW